MILCVSNSQNPLPGTEIVEAHPFSDGLYSLTSPEVLKYCATMAKNTKNPRQRFVPNHFFMEVGDFNPKFANIHDVFWTKSYSGLFKVKVPLLQHLLKTRGECSRYN